MSRTGMLLREPVERVWAEYEGRREELDGRGWELADLYLELGGGGPRSSELHLRFADFFNGQARTAVAGRPGAAGLEFWAGMPERAAAMRDEALANLAKRGPVEIERGAPEGRPDPCTRSLILAHNQLDAELYAHFAAVAEREAGARVTERRTPSAPRAANAPRGPVCVLGAPRSGTSATARVLNLLGVDLGTEAELMPATAGNNPAGFWEHQAIADLNEEVLATLGEAPRQRWRHPPELPAGWERDARLATHLDTARSILRQSFAGRPLWGWKDPRTSLTLPFWLSALAETPEVESEEMRYVICLRHPLDVTASLRARDEMPREEALALWQRYMADTLAHTAEQPRIVVSYESYFPGWEEQVERLCRFLGRPLPTVEERGRIAAHFDETLRHHHEGATGADAELPDDVHALYDRLFRMGS